jgi:sigma-E factor negative regulatory protein RseA
VIPDELESQLSAMFDGELPATECELLSRRIERDEALRARWSRYALIGAAMRSEPVATAPSGFARRVSAALRSSEAKPTSRRGRRMLLSTALSACLVLAVAASSISLLRYAALGSAGADIAQTPALPAPSAALPAAAAIGRSGAMLAASAAPSGFAAAMRRSSNGEPVSYVTPASAASAHTALRTELADFIVAHSQYSTPLMRRNLLSSLVSNEDGADNASPGVDAAGAPASSAAGAFDAITAASAARH